MTYAIIFSLIDLLNIMIGFFQKAYSKPLVESYFQVKKLKNVIFILKDLFNHGVVSFHGMYLWAVVRIYGFRG